MTNGRRFFSSINTWLLLLFKCFSSAIELRETRELLYPFHSFATTKEEKINCISFRANLRRNGGMKRNRRRREGIPSYVVH